MKQLKFLLILFLSLSCGACSATPGDAALRAGQYVAAADLYHQGATMHDAKAANKLGLLISNNYISSTQYGPAIKWFMLACKSGNLAGCHNSGNGFEYGQFGAKKSYNQAKYYYSLAANKGYIQSQYNLGSLYSNHYIHNDVEGLKWMLIAYNGANSYSSCTVCQWILKDPPRHRATLMKRMTKNQINQAEQLANAWKTKETPFD